MPTAVLSGFVVAAVAPLIHRLAGRRTGLVLALFAAVLTAYFAAHLPAVARGERITANVAWVHDLGLRLSFLLDGLGLLLALLVTGIGALVLHYAGGYLAGDPRQGRFFAWLVLFMASMLGLVLADNVLAIFLFWELTSVSSYLLIGFDHERERSRSAALQALLVTGVGGLALLAGLLLLGTAGGSFETSELVAQGALVRENALYPAILVLVLLGAFTKSAQFPFHFWLPSAMEAPTPVSAYLHSATMVKAGVYLLARLSPVLGGTESWRLSLSAVGAATLLVGGVLALRNTDLKRMLAYSTISALGVLVLLIGTGTDAAVTAAVTFLLAHALYKGALFLVAGAVEHETGTRDAGRLGALRRAMPITAAAAALAAVSLAGAGPALGFVAKESLLEALLEARLAPSVLLVVAVLGSASFVAVAAIVSLRVFFGRPKVPLEEVHEGSPSLWLGSAILAASGFLLVLVLEPLGRVILAPAASAVRGVPTGVSLALWHGLTPALLMSGVSIALGALVCARWGSVRRALGWIDTAARVGPERLYSLALGGLAAVAAANTRILQGGSLRRYLLVTVTTTVTITGWLVARSGEALWPAGLGDLLLHEAVLFFLIIAGTILVVTARSSLKAIVALGIVGYSLALVFVSFGAPDLAMTQFLVETLTVVLFLLVLYHLPPFARLSSPPARARDALVAGAVGAVMTTLVLAAARSQTGSELSPFFAENSVPRAHGRNIVNVILVDFRALDTLGEITVLAVAAIGIRALLKLRVERTSNA